MDIDFDDAGVGRHFDAIDARIERRRITLDADGKLLFARDRFDRAEQFEIIVELRRRRHEDAQHAVARLDGQRGAHRAFGGELFDLRLLFRAGPRMRDLAELHRLGQFAARVHRVLFVNEGVVRRLDVGQRLHRQAQADRRVAGHEKELAAPERPALAAPGGLGLRVPALHRQHEAGRTRQAVVEGAHHARALFRIVDLRVAGIDVDRQRALPQQPIGRVLVSRDDVVGLDAETHGDFAGERLSVPARRGRAGAGPRDQQGVLPDRLAVLAPKQREGPARQALAGIPFALAVMQEAAGRETRLQAPDQRLGARLLVSADGRRVPFRGVVIVDRDEGRLAAHGQAHVLRDEIAIDLFAERVELAPGGVGEGQRHARRLAQPRHVHVEAEGDLRRLDEAGDRRRRAEMRRRAQRQMAFAAEQARSRVHADPAGAGDIDLGPGVQVGEILVRAARAFDRIDVGPELDEIARDETRGEAEPAQDLHQQPGRIAARARAQRQRLVRLLDARLHADDVMDHPLQFGVERDQKRNRPSAPRRDLLEIFRQQRAAGLGREIGGEFGRELIRIGERKFFGVGLDEKVEGIDDREFGRQIDLDLEFLDRLGKDVAREPVAVRDPAAN